MAKVRRSTRVAGDITPAQLRRASEEMVRQATLEMLRVMVRDAPRDQPAPELSASFNAGFGEIVGEIRAKEKQPKRKRGRRGGGKSIPLSQVLKWLREGKGAGIERPEAADPDAAEQELAFVIQQRIKRNVATRPLSQTKGAKAKRRRKAKQQRQAPLNAAADTVVRAADSEL